jgi:hypothetical protein
MSEQATSGKVDENTAPSASLADKGKGKAPAQEQPDISMGEEEDDSSDNESGVEEPVRLHTQPQLCLALTFNFSRLVKVTISTELGGGVADAN